MDQHTLIRAAPGMLASVPDLVALFLAGSFGRGTADAYSDVDFVAIAGADHLRTVAQTWRASLEALEPVIFWNERQGSQILLNAVTESWLRCDLHILAPADFIGRSKDTVKPLIDKTDIYGKLPDSLPPYEPSRDRISWMIREFIRVLGLLPVAIGRGEYLTAVKGFGLQRDLLTDFLLENTPGADRGGILHLSRQLSKSDMALLSDLPSPAPNREDVIGAHLAIAELFLPKAKETAAHLGIDWPQEFEAKTKEHLWKSLNIEFSSE